MSEPTHLYGRYLREAEISLACHYLVMRRDPLSSSRLVSEHFHLVPGLQEMWAKALAIESSGSVVDITALGREGDGNFDQLVEEIIDYSSRYMPHQRDIHEAKLMEASVLRMCKSETSAIATQISEQEIGPDEIRSKLMALTEAIDQGQPDIEISAYRQAACDQAREIVQAVKSGREVGYPMPLASMQSALNGWRPGRTHMVIAPTSCHKTTMLRMSAHTLASAGIPTVFVSYEDPIDDIVARSLACEPGARFTTSDLMTLSLGERGLSDLISTISLVERNDIPMSICDRAMPIDRLIAFMHQCVSKRGAKAFCIDYLQLIRGRKPRQNESDHLETVATRIQHTTKDLGVPVIIAAQITQEATRLAETINRIPGKGDIRGSSSIAQSSFGVIAMHFPLQAKEGTENVNGRDTRVRDMERVPNRIAITARKWKQAATNAPIMCGLDAAHDRIYDLDVERWR